ncbi:HNH endonuclease signature motif containing protein [Georgenia satyanarayanai]|uniref:HNH endonuclease signature motif containing protein n=1 Tax=Georgenia satyanarayanai TaxID=860221 RepID=UPI001264F863|nr:HNH endonuclease signature motif containing protein [Georgenia satyanarayanai]
MDRDDREFETAAGSAPTDPAEDSSPGLVVPYLESLGLVSPGEDRLRLDVSRPTGPDHAPPAEWAQFRLPAYRESEPPGWPHSVLAELIPQPGALGDYLEHLPPGLRLARVLEEIDPQDVDDFSLVEVVAAHKRMEAWSAGRAARAAAALAERDSVNPTWPGDVPGRTRGECVVGQELAMRLRITKQAAVKMATCGRAVGGMFQPTGELLDQGLIDWPRAQAIITTLIDLPAEVAMAAQWEVLDKAPGRTLRQVQEDLAKAVIAVDPDSADDRHTAARRKRCVHHPRPLPDGMATMTALLPAADAVALDLALDGAARAARNAGDSRTLDQLRADSLALMGHSALVLGHIGPEAHLHCPCGCQQHGAPAGSAASAGPPAPPPAPDAPPSAVPSRPDPGAAPTPSAGSPPSAGPSPTASFPPSASSSRLEPRTPRLRVADGPPSPGHRLPGCSLPTTRVGMIGGGRADIRVTVPVTALQPEPRQPGTTALDRDREPVAELERYGPIPPIVARALSAGGVWRRLVTDPTGSLVLDVGRTRYEPPAAIADHVRERDRTCIRPGCSSSSPSSDLDHIHEWQHGGITSAENLGPVCTGDHRAKSIGAFTVAYASDRTYAWTTPTGHGYLRRPDGTVATLPRHTAEGLRRLAKETVRRGVPVAPALVDAALAAASAGTDTAEAWALPAGPTAPPPGAGHDTSWAGDQPPF